MLLVTGCNGVANKVAGYKQGRCVSACLLSCRRLSRLHFQLQHKTGVLQTSLHHLLQQPDHIVVWFTRSSLLRTLFSSCFIEFLFSCEHSFLCAVLLPFFWLLPFILSYLSLYFKFSHFSLHCCDSGAI
jgi:hypothetical protein